MPHSCGFAVQRHDCHSAGLKLRWLARPDTFDGACDEQLISAREAMATRIFPMHPSQWKTRAHHYCVVNDAICWVNGAVHVGGLFAQAE